MSVVFPESGLTGDALWSTLYLAGYLTTEDTEDPNDQYLLRRLRVPNKEIARVFSGEVVERFRSEAGGTERLRQLHLSLVAGNAAAVEAGLSRILMTSPSCRDLTSENSYHMLLVGLLFGVPGYGVPLSNREEGQGYYDLRLSPEERSGRPLREDLPVITVEFKALSSHDAPSDPKGLARRLGSLRPGAWSRSTGKAMTAREVRDACATASRPAARTWPLPASGRVVLRAAAPLSAETCPKTTKTNPRLRIRFRPSQGTKANSQTRVRFRSLGGQRLCGAGIECFSPAGSASTLT